MIAKKIIGYILGAAGIIFLVLSYEQVRTQAGIVLPEPITETYLLISGIVLALVGAFFIFNKKGGRKKQSPEVPIYHGKEIVGYRRH